MSIANVIAENRRSFRRRVLKRGKVLLHDNTTVLDGLIRDVSDGGAQLVMEHASTLPITFRMANVSDGDVREMRVVWRRGDQACHDSPM